MAITRIKNNQITDSTIVGSSKIEALSVTSGLLENDLTYGSNLTVTGNLTVNGTTTTINTTNTAVDDPILLLASQQTGVAAVDIGYLGERGDDANVAFVWDESADEFIAAFTSTSESFTSIIVSSYANMHVNDMQADGAFTLTGLANLDGGIAVDGTNFTVSGTTGAVSTTSTLDATGLATLGSATINGATDINGVLTTQDITVDAASTIDVGTNKITNLGTPVATTDAATKAYVDGIATGGFTFDGDTGSTTISAGDTMLIQGTALEIETAVSGDTMTVGLPSAVSVTTSLTTPALSSSNTLAVTGISTLTGLVNANGGIAVDGTAFVVADTTGNTSTTGTLTVGALTDLDGGLTVGAVTIDAASVLDAGANKWTNLADPTVAQDAATKAYVDGEISAGWTLDDGVTQQVISGGDTLTLQGTALEVDVAVSAVDVMTIGLPSDVTIANDLTVTGNTGTATLGVSGISTLGVVNASGLASLDGGIDVDGVFTVADTTGNTVFTGTVIANSTTDLNGLLTTQAITVDAASVLDMGANKVTNVADPVANQDAATKSYVDGIASDGFTLTDGVTPTTISGSDTLTVSGTALEVDVVTGVDSLTIGLPTNVTIAGTLDTVGLATLASASVTAGLDINGTTTLTDITFDAASTIDMGANRVTNVLDPTAAQDATTKNYVDALVTSGTLWRDPVKDPDVQDIVTTAPTLAGAAGDTLTYIYNGAGETLDDGGTTLLVAAGDVAVATITNAVGPVADWTKIESAPVEAGDRFIIAAEHGDIGTTLYGMGFRKNDLIQYVSGTLNLFASWSAPHDAGYQAINFDTAKAAGDSTGLVATTSYTLDVSFDGTPSTLSVASTGTEVDTFGELAAALSTQANAAHAGASVTLETEGHFHVTSGDGTKVIVDEGTGGTPLLAALSTKLPMARYGVFGRAVHTPIKAIWPRTRKVGNRSSKPFAKPVCWYCVSETI